MFSCKISVLSFEFGSSIGQRKVACLSAILFRIIINMPSIHLIKLQKAIRYENISDNDKRSFFKKQDYFGDCVVNRIPTLFLFTSLVESTGRS